jgi:hypothetical protein
MSNANRTSATPTPADEQESLECYRAAWTRAQLERDRNAAIMLAQQIRQKPWPTLHEAATSLVREIEHAYLHGDLSRAAEKARSTRTRRSPFAGRKAAA